MAEKKSRMHEWHCGRGSVAGQAVDRRQNALTYSQLGGNTEQVRERNFHSHKVAEIEGCPTVTSALQIARVLADAREDYLMRSVQLLIHVGWEGASKCTGQPGNNADGPLRAAT